MPVSLKVVIAALLRRNRESDYDAQGRGPIRAFWIGVGERAAEVPGGEHPPFLLCSSHDQSGQTHFFVRGSIDSSSSPGRGLR